MVTGLAIAMIRTSTFGAQTKVMLEPGNPSQPFRQLTAKLTGFRFLKIFRAGIANGARGCHPSDSVICFSTAQTGSVYFTLAAYGGQITTRQPIIIATLRAESALELPGVACGAILMPLMNPRYFPNPLATFIANNLDRWSLYCFHHRCCISSLRCKRRHIRMTS
jgi:hypothetical protein